MKWGAMTMELVVQKENVAYLTTENAKLTEHAKLEAEENTKFTTENAKPPNS